MTLARTIFVLLILLLTSGFTSLKLNDTAYRFEGEISAKEKFTVAPTYIVEQGI